MCSPAGSAPETRQSPHDPRPPRLSPPAVAGAGRDRGPRRHHGAGAASAAGTAGAIGGGQMSVGYRAVQWNRRKIIYDAILIAGVILFIGTYMTVGAIRHPPADKPAWIDLRINALGTCAFT